VSKITFASPEAPSASPDSPIERVPGMWRENTAYLDLMLGEPSQSTEPQTKHRSERCAPTPRQGLCAQDPEVSRGLSTVKF